MAIFRKGGHFPGISPGVQPWAVYQYGDKTYVRPVGDTFCSQGKEGGVEGGVEGGAGMVVNPGQQLIQAGTTGWVCAIALSTVIR